MNQHTGNSRPNIELIPINVLGSEHVVQNPWRTHCYKKQKHEGIITCSSVGTYWRCLKAQDDDGITERDAIDEPFQGL